MNKKTISIITLGIILQLTWYGLLWGNMVTQPQIAKLTDFSIFYTSGQIADNQYSDIYNLEIQRNYQENLQGKSLQDGGFLPFNHPPILIPLQQIISTGNYIASYIRWNLLMVFFLGIIAWLISRLLQKWNWNSNQVKILVFTTLFSYPVFISLLKGQDSIFLVLGITLWAYGLLNQKDSLAGLGLAMTSIRPQFVLVLAIPFLFKRQKVWLWFMVFAIIPAISFIRLGIKGVQDFINILLISARGNGYFLSQNAMFNLSGLLIRAFPQVPENTIHIIVWAAFVASIIGLSIVWSKSKTITIKHISFAILLSTFVSPHLHYHDISPMILPMLFTINEVKQNHTMGESKLILIPTISSLILLFSDLSFRFIMFYVLMVVWGLWICLPDLHNQISDWLSHLRFQEN